ncbi:mammalian cell entry protein [Bacteroidia bacterium]|nr:mammalian cell entry protein [Bacteroidia bacterium]
MKMKRGFTKEAKIGIMTIASIALLYIGINYLKGINLFKPSNMYYVVFDNVKDVNISSPVFVEGFKVGLVRTISYDYSNSDKIKVEVSLDDHMKINKGSYVQIVKSFLGGAELHIRLNKYNDEYVKSGETLEGRMSENMMGTVENNILPMLVNMMPKIDSILSSLQILVSDPSLAQSLTHIEQTTANLESSSRQLTQLLNKDVPFILTDLKTVTGNFTEVSENLKGLHQPLMATIQSVNTTLANLQLTTEKLNSKDNSIGLLLNDNSLYDNLNGTMENASKLLIDFKEHPKRYVHFSLF